MCVRVCVSKCVCVCLRASVFAGAGSQQCDAAQ